MIDRIAIPARDHVRLSLMIDAMDGDVMRMITLGIPVNPPPKVRHRYRVAGTGRKRFVQTYADPEDVAAEQLTAQHLRGLFRGELWTGNIAVAGIFYRANRQPIDYDNMLKHLGDAGNGVAWTDDHLITGGCGIVELDAANPRSVLAFAPHRSTMLRGTDAVGPCRACGRPRDLDRLFCSTECAGTGRRKGFVPYGTVAS